jgi:hypothetical protein
MKNKIPFIPFLIATILLHTHTSCKKSEAPIAPNECNRNTVKPIFNTANINELTTIKYDASVCGLLPLNKQHKWIYKDSLFDDAGNFKEIKMDTLYVEKTVQSSADNSILWKMKSTRLKGLPNYIYTTDSTLYFVDLMYNAANNKPFVATEWLKLPTQDSVRKYSFVSDYGYIETIKKLKTNTTVPAGSFSNCFYTSKSIDGIEEIVFKPELGVVKYTKYSPYGNPFNPLPTDKIQVSELVAYIP